VALLSFYGSSVTQSFFTPREQAVRMRDIGAALQAVTDVNDLAIVVDDYGIMSPILLYFAHLKGWSFEATDVSPAVIENLRGLGARYFVTTRWRDLKSETPDAAAVLEMYQDLLIADAPADTRLIDLRLRK